MIEFYWLVEPTIFWKREGQKPLNINSKDGKEDQKKKVGIKKYYSIFITFLKCPSSFLLRWFSVTTSNDIE